MPVPIPLIAGSFALPAAKLRRMVAASPTFQDAIGANTPDEAVEFVFLSRAVGDTPRPYAVVSPGQNHEYELEAGGSQNQLIPRGGCFLYLTMDTSPEYFDDENLADFEAATFFGQITDDIAAISGQDDPGSPWSESHLPIVTLTMTSFGHNPEDTWVTLGRFYMATYNVLWSNS